MVLQPVFLWALTHLTLPDNTAGHFNPCFSHGHYCPGRSVFGTLDNTLWQGRVKGRTEGHAAGFLLDRRPTVPSQKNTTIPSQSKLGSNLFIVKVPSLWAPPPSKPIEKPQAWECPREGGQSIRRLCSALWPGQCQQGGYMRKGC